MFSPSAIHIREPKAPEEFEKYYLLRYQLLRAPWHQPRGSEMDDNENTSIHIMACDENDTLYGVCRLQFNTSKVAQLRYMGVGNDARETGIGRRMIEYAENKAKEGGAVKMILQARENAVGFYKKCGYQMVEKSYLMLGEIQHYLMEKELK